jgi:NitT/TauT family transport system substrate-binding protein
MKSGRGISKVLFWMAAGMLVASGARGDSIPFNIGTTDTVTNTVTTGIVIRKLNLLQKYLPNTGAYSGKSIEVSWQNFTSGPPITNAMMADKLQVGAMGDYPLVINGSTFLGNKVSHSALVAVAGYNLFGSGNGIVANKASPYYSLQDLKDKVVSVPFGSAAHGMVLKALADAGLPDTYFHLVNQSPEVGSTNLQEQKIDAHADFVPFPELLPYRGFARKIYDGAETNLPTWHGVVVRTDFAEKYPEIIVAYLRAIIDADAWVKADPKQAAEKIAEWTGTDKEVVYIFLGPGGIMTLDPTIKPALVQAGGTTAKFLEKLGRVSEFSVDQWVDDSYLRKAYAEAGLDYDKAAAITVNYEITGEDRFCGRPIVEPRAGGEIWIKDGAIEPLATTACLLQAYGDLYARGEKIDVAYVFDHSRGIKLFASFAFYVVNTASDVVPFMLRSDAAAYAAKVGGTVKSFEDAVAAVRKRG